MRRSRWRLTGSKAKLKAGCKRTFNGKNGERKTCDDSFEHMRTDGFIAFSG